MPLDSSLQLLDLLHRERLLTDPELQQAERLASQFPLARDLVAQLRRGGILTPFQADLLQRGKAADLVIKDYVLLEPRGEGAMGKVYKARHRMMNRLVAVKVMRPEALNFPQAVKRFEREMQVAAQVDHPNIIRALDAGRSGETYFYAMEFVNGIDLAHLVEEQGPLPLPLACDFAHQVALGLQHIHEQGIVHRAEKRGRDSRAELRKGDATEWH